MDAASGYHQIHLEEESAKYTTFITPFGRYKFARVPFGIMSVSEIFQRRMSEMLQGIEGISVYHDDIIVAGRTLEEHDRRLEAVFFNAVRKAGIKLNQKKCLLRQEKLDFLGHCFSSEGVQVSASKVKAVSEMKPPTNVSELRRFLGMINYVGG